MDKTPLKAIDPCDLERLIMDSNIAKTESAWWAKREIESLRIQIVELTKTNLEQVTRISELDQENNRLCVLAGKNYKDNGLAVNELCYQQAARIEELLAALKRHQDLTRPLESTTAALEITPSKALAAFAAKVREQCAVVCDGLQHQRNNYIEEDGAEGKPFVPRDCAEAIRNLKELP